MTKRRRELLFITSTLDLSPVATHEECTLGTCWYIFKEVTKLVDLQSSRTGHLASFQNTTLSTFLNSSFFYFFVVLFFNIYFIPTWAGFQEWARCTSKILIFYCVNIISDLHKGVPSIYIRWNFIDHKRMNKWLIYICLLMQIRINITKNLEWIKYSVSVDYGNTGLIGFFVSPSPF